MLVILEPKVIVIVILILLFTVKLLLKVCLIKISESWIKYCFIPLKGIMNSNFHKLFSLLSKKYNKIISFPILIKRNEYKNY
jgi:hypothetical protein